jgi:hypothetical protein
MMGTEETELIGDEAELLLWLLFRLLLWLLLMLLFLLWLLQVWLLILMLQSESVSSQLLLDVQLCKNVEIIRLSIPPK